MRSDIKETVNTSGEDGTAAASRTDRVKCNSQQCCRCCCCCRRVTRKPVKLDCTGGILATGMVDCNYHLAEVRDRRYLVLLHPDRFHRHLQLPIHRKVLGLLQDCHNLQSDKINVNNSSPAVGRNEI